MVAQLAQLDGCSRQAVLARIQGNSRHQGGLLKKAISFWLATNATEDIAPPAKGLLAIDTAR